MECRKLIIRHIGPISEVNIELNKVNVFIGKQGSGKSTIAKIYSFCSWLEKTMILNVSFSMNYLEELKKFHRFSNAYFNEDSYIEYQTPYFKLEWNVLSEPKFHVTIGTDNVFQNNKIIYIPAERNFVSSIPNLGKYNESSDNIMNLLYDWYSAKKLYSESTQLQIPGLDAKYYYTKENDQDHLSLNDGKDLSLQTASSGFQSIVPLITLVEYIVHHIYTKEKSISPFERLKIEELSKHINSEIAKKTLSAYLAKLFETIDSSDREKLKTSIDSVNESFLSFYNTLGVEIRYMFSQLIIEEPEQNLFPETQRDLIYYLIKSILHSDRDHRMILTTHSPYILYALNNCMLGGLVKDSVSSEEKDNLQSKDAWIEPDLVSVWQIKEDGTLGSTKDPRSGTIGKQYFNDVMNGVLNEYYALLKYVKPTKG